MLKHCLIVFGVSMVPLIELRGAIPYGIAFGLPLWQTYCIAIVGNMLPVPIIYFLRPQSPGLGLRQEVYRQVFYLVPAKGRKGRPKAPGKGGPGAVLGTAAVCGHPTARHRRLDRDAGGQHFRHGI